MEYRSYCNWRSWYTLQRIIKGTGWLGNYCIIESGQNTEKSPGNLRRVAVTQTSVKDYQLTLMRRNDDDDEDNNWVLRKISPVNSDLFFMVQGMLRNVCVYVFIGSPKLFSIFLEQLFFFIKPHFWLDVKLYNFLTIFGDCQYHFGFLFDRQMCRNTFMSKQPGPKINLMRRFLLPFQ